MPQWLGAPPDGCNDGYEDAFVTQACPSFLFNHGAAARPVTLPSPSMGGLQYCANACQPAATIGPATASVSGSLRLTTYWFNPIFILFGGAANGYRQLAVFRRNLPPGKHS